MLASSSKNGCEAPQCISFACFVSKTDVNLQGSGVACRSVLVLFERSMKVPEVPQCLSLACPVAIDGVNLVVHSEI